MRPGLLRGIIVALTIEAIAAIFIYVIVFSTKGPQPPAYVRCPTFYGSLILPYDGPDTCTKDLKP